MKIEVNATGFAALIGNLANLPDEWTAAAGGAIYEEGSEILTVSREEFVPVMLGVLKASGFVTTPTTERDEVSVTIGYGGAAAAYALAVHEHPSGFSPPSWQAAEAHGNGVHFRVGGPKYLERPFLAAEAGMEERIALRMRTRIGGI